MLCGVDVDVDAARAKRDEAGARIGRDGTRLLEAVLAADAPAARWTSPNLVVNVATTVATVAADAVPALIDAGCPPSAASGS